MRRVWAGEKRHADCVNVRVKTNSCFAPKSAIYAGITRSLKRTLSGAPDGSHFASDDLSLSPGNRASYSRA
jgi:hypothetical protein